MIGVCMIQHIYDIKIAVVRGFCGWRLVCRDEWINSQQTILQTIPWLVRLFSDRWCNTQKLFLIPRPWCCPSADLLFLLRARFEVRVLETGQRWVNVPLRIFLFLEFFTVALFAGIYNQTTMPLTRRPLPGPCDLVPQTIVRWTIEDYEKPEILCASNEPAGSIHPAEATWGCEYMYRTNLPRATFRGKSLLIGCQ